jgi:ubiquinone/menaquinone biosynthesis C-methylase UbiE
MKWLPLRKSSGESLAVSMAGIKLGDRLLIVGCADPILIARLAVKTGLTGRAYAVDERDPLVATAAEVAAREGALIEAATASWTTLPLESDGFDVAVVRDVLPHLAPERRGGCVAEIRRLLRPGGRCLVVDGGGRTGVAALVHGASALPDYTAHGGAVPIFTAHGFKAARILAEREGLVFAEAVKPNHSSRIANP